MPLHICEGCNCICGLCDNDACECECHYGSKMLSCMELVSILKQVNPTLDVSALANVHRNTFFGFLENSLDEDERVAFFDIVSVIAHKRFTPSASTVVPSNIAELVGSQTRKSEVQRSYNDKNVYTVVGVNHTAMKKGRSLQQARALLDSAASKLKTVASVGKKAVAKPGVRKPARKAPAAKRKCVRDT